MFRIWYRIRSDPEPFELVGSGSDLFLTKNVWYRQCADPDPEWVKNQDPDTGSGSGMNIPDRISESLKTIFGLKIRCGSGMRNLFDPCIQDGKMRVRDKKFRICNIGYSV
jgi:hypothetical protein